MSEGRPPAYTGSGPVAPVATLPLSEESSPDAVPALGSVIADKYRIEELIARGGMGAVYMATHLVSGKRVALKWMLPALGQVPGAKERFVREACATARIEHPNVIDIYDVGSDRGSVYLVMELLRGETLAEYLQRVPSVSPTEAVQLLMPALRGVAAAHAHHVIHRDLKPDNIFLCRSAEGEPREPRVLDFGISKIGSGEDTRDLSLTRSGAVMGTPYYMSPEQVRGARDVDERGDIYAFGVMLYEMITGQRPFDAETYNQLILKIATEDPAPIRELKPNLDPRLAAIIERAMAREPSARFASIEELALALEPLADGALFRSSIVRSFTPSGDSGEQHTLRHDRAPVRRSRSFIALGIVLGCITAGIGFWALSQARSRQDDRNTQATDVRPAQPTAASVEVVPPETAAAAATAPTAPAAAAAVAPDAPAPETSTATQPDRPRRVRGQDDERERGVRKREAKGPAKSADANAAEARSPSPQNKLPDDWDERLSIPAKATERSSSPAGPIDVRDLR